MKHIINNKDYTEEVNSLTNFSQKRLGFSKVPKILFDNDVSNSHKTLGKTGYYDPNSGEIHIYSTGRHIKDILRSLAHEFVHHMQNEKGDLNNDGYMGKGYAQKNPKMREMERQAYEIGNLCFRDWEDSLKQNEPTIYNERRNYNMSLNEWKNKELNKLLLEKFNITKKEYILEENKERIFAPNHYCAHHVVYEGKKGHTVDHNWNTKLKKVTRYDVKLEDGSIIRNIHESKLTILEAFVAEGHGSHPAKRDEEENEDEDNDIENKEKADLDDDGKLSGYEKKRAKAIEKSMKNDEEKDEKDSSKKALQEHIEEGMKRAISRYNSIINDYKSKKAKK